MNLLIDESLQHDLARLLGQAGHNAVHVTDLGLRGAADETLLAKAAHDDRVIVTDTDFGTLLALTGASEPSVILLAAADDGPPNEHTSCSPSSRLPVSISSEARSSPSNTTGSASASCP